MNNREPEILDITRFIMSVAIVFLHGYTTVQMYDYLSVLPVYQSVTRIFALQIGEIGVPTFFIISGYLFFRGYKQTWECYKYKMQKRFYSLIIPYLIWNCLMILGFYVAECIPAIRELFNDGKKLVHDFGFIDFLGAFWARKDGGPILDQLWFVRNLIVLVICSPIIYYIVRYTKIIGIAVLGMFWFFSNGMAYPQSSIFYFSLGAWFSINAKSMTSEIRKIGIFLFLFFPLLTLADNLFNGTPIGYYLHRLQTFTGVFFVLALVTVLLEKNKIRAITFFCSSSFFLYLAHDPLLRFMRKFFLKFVDQSSEWQAILCYFGTIVVNIAIVYAIYWLLRKYTPGFLKYATGGR